MCVCACACVYMSCTPPMDPYCYVHNNIVVVEMGCTYMYRGSYVKKVRNEANITL